VIVLAHFKESLDYYKLLEVAELEGDLVKAVAKGNAEKVKNYYKRLAAAKDRSERGGVETNRQIGGESGDS